MDFIISAVHSLTDILLQLSLRLTAATALLTRKIGKILSLSFYLDDAIED